MEDTTTNTMKIYVLKCENNKYYVGRTKNIEKRVIQHFTLDGSKWTKKYKPIEIINQYDGDEFDEEKYTLLTMDKYGIENVRGGSYCKMKLSKYDIDKIQQTIYSIMDKCYYVVVMVEIIYVLLFPIHYSYTTSLSNNQMVSLSHHNE
jgi:hypothetical protein